MAAYSDVQQQKPFELTWEKHNEAPQKMFRGAAVVHDSVCYFRPSSSHYVLKYNSEKDDWSELPQCPQKSFGLVVINNYLTAVGGDCSDGKYTNCVVSLYGSEWVTCFPPMPTKRYQHVVISAQNYLIAAGGCGEGRVILSTVEVMNIATHEWYTAESLPEPVYHISATVCGRRIYILGGYDKKYKATHAVFTCTIDSLLHSCYPLSQTQHHNNVWQYISDVPVVFSTCITMKGQVLAVGGMDSLGHIKNAVYWYDSNHDSWKLVGQMPTARYLCQVVGLRDCIIAVGGYTLPQSIASVEVGYLQFSENQSHYKAYELALKEGAAMPLKYIKVLFFGPPQAGKTSTRRRLVGEIQNLAKEPAQASTGTAENYDIIVKVNKDRTTASTSIIKKSKWSTVKDFVGNGKNTHETDLNEELRLLYKTIYEVGLSHVRDPVDEKEAQDDTAKGQGSAMMQTDTTSSPIQVRSPKAAIKCFNASVLSDREPGYGVSEEEMKQIEKAFVAFKEVLLTPGQEELKMLLDGTVLMNMVDTGSQPAFLEMLPALTIGPALYLIFFKLNQMLNASYKIQYISEDNEVVQFEDSSYTIQDVVIQALSSIACFSCTTPNKANMPNPSHVAMLVGTHMDLLGSDPETVATEIEARDFELQETLSEMLETEDFESKKNFLQHASDDQLIFAINNMTGDERELTNVRKRLEDIIEQEFDSFPIPASWLMFNIFLRKMGKRTLSLLQCYVIGDKLKVKDTDEALWFLHHRVGTLMYYPEIEEIKDVVICDPQVVFDSVTNLILNSFKLNRVSKSACAKFKETGQFCFKDIQKITKNSKSDSLPLPKLVKLLEYLNIIAPITPLTPGISPQSSAYHEENVVYFMPAVLKHAKKEELHIKQNPTDPAPLMVYFKCGFVPLGVFCAMIASLVAKKSTLRWTLLKPHQDCCSEVKLPKPREGHILCKNKVTFRIDGSHDITLISKPKRYEIHIASEDRATLVEICQQVLKHVCDTLDQVISKLKYKQCITSSSDQTLYELGFKCPKHPNDDHLVINRPISGVEVSFQSAKSLWLNYIKGKSIMICPLEGGKAIDLRDTRFSQSFAQQSLIWFGEATEISSKLTAGAVATPLEERAGSQQQPTYTLDGHSVEHVNDTSVLDENDLQNVRSAVADLAGKWKDLGISLGISASRLDTLVLPSPNESLREMLTLWLRQCYNVNKFKKPTWRRLMEAVKDRVGGDNPALAQKIATEHFAMATEGASNQKKAIAQTKTPDDTSDNYKLLKDKDDTCTTAVDKETAATPPCTPVPQQQDSSSNSEGEYTDMYEADKEYDEPPYASQPMITGKHGASYTPPGWKSKRVKQEKLYLTPSEHTESEKSDDSASGD